MFLCEWASCVRRNALFLQVASAGWVRAEYSFLPSCYLSEKGHPGGKGLQTPAEEPGRDNRWFYN